MKQDLEQHLSIKKLSHFFLPTEHELETQVSAHSFIVNLPSLPGLETQDHFLIKALANEANTDSLHSSIFNKLPVASGKPQISMFQFLLCNMGKIATLFY